MTSIHAIGAALAFGRFDLPEAQVQYADTSSDLALSRPTLLAEASGTHPRDLPSKVIYLPRTGSMVAKDGRLLPLEQRVGAFAAALAKAGPNGTVEFEVLGSRGSYVPEFKQVLLPSLLTFAAVADHKVGHINGYFSGFAPGRTTAIGRLAESRGAVLATWSDGRSVVNLGDDKVFGEFTKVMTEYLDACKNLGLLHPDVSIDDHFGVRLPPEKMALFLKANHLANADEGRALITRRFVELTDPVRKAGGEVTLSLVGKISYAKTVMVDAVAIAPKIDHLELQAYVNSVADMRQFLNETYHDILAHPNAFANIKSFRIALYSSLPEHTAIDMQSEIARFGDRLAGEAQRLGLAPNRWRVETALFPFSGFYPPHGKKH